MWYDELIQTRACAQAIEYAKTYQSFDEAWQACQHGDWMLWYLARKDWTNTQDDIERLVCLAIRFVQRLPCKGKIDVWEKWANNYLSGVDRTAARAAEAAWAAEAAKATLANAEAARAAWVAEAAEAAEAAWTARATGAAWAAWAKRAAEAAWAAWATRPSDVVEAANIIREYFPYSPK